MANKKSTLFLYRSSSHSFHKVYISAKSGCDLMIRIIFKLNTSATACMTAGFFCRSQVTGCRSQVTGCRLQVTGCRSQVAGHRSQVAGRIKIKKAISNTDDTWVTRDSQEVPWTSFTVQILTSQVTRICICFIQTSSILLLVPLSSDQSKFISWDVVP